MAAGDPDRFDRLPVAYRDLRLVRTGGKQLGRAIDGESGKRIAIDMGDHHARLQSCILARSAPADLGMRSPSRAAAYFMSNIALAMESATPGMKGRFRSGWAALRE